MTGVQTRRTETGYKAVAVMALEALRQSNQWDGYWRMAVYQQNQPAPEGFAAAPRVRFMSKP
jgi:hypothetical protein